MSTIDPDSSMLGLDPTTRQFTLWGLAMLKLRVESIDSHVYAIHAPDDSPGLFNGATSVHFTFEPVQGMANGSQLEWVTPSSRLFTWLVGRLRGLGEVLHTAPADQPASVREISSRLFAAYQVQGGRVHLGGCTLEDRPLLRLTYRLADQGSGDRERGDRERIIHFYTFEGSSPVDAETLGLLGVEEMQAVVRRSRNLREDEIQHWLESSKRLAHEGLREGDAQLIASVFVWCKYASGKLSFVIGQESVEIPFAGWARPLVRGLIQPPPYTCAWTGKQSYHLAATGDGRITVAEAMAACAESGERVLTTELEVCELTGKYALPGHLERCPVSAQRVVRSALVVCGMCGQRVSPKVIKSARCAACRELRSISKDEPRMARILHEFPRLDGWRGWKISETDSVYVLTASTLMRELLFVVDKESLEPRRLATAGRFARSWSDVPPLEQGEYLQGMSLG